MNSRSGGSKILEVRRWISRVESFLKWTRRVGYLVVVLITMVWIYKVYDSKKLENYSEPLLLFIADCLALTLFLQSWISEGVISATQVQGTVLSKEEFNALPDVDVSVGIVGLSDSGKTKFVSGLLQEAYDKKSESSHLSVQTVTMRNDKKSLNWAFSDGRGSKRVDQNAIATDCDILICMLDIIGGQNADVTQDSIEKRISKNMAFHSNLLQLPEIVEGTNYVSDPCIAKQAFPKLKRILILCNKIDVWNYDKIKMGSDGESWKKNFAGDSWKEKMDDLLKAGDDLCKRIVKAEFFGSNSAKFVTVMESSNDTTYEFFKVVETLKKLANESRQDS